MIDHTQRSCAVRKTFAGLGSKKIVARLHSPSIKPELRDGLRTAALTATSQQRESKPFANDQLQKNMLLPAARRFEALQQYQIIE